MKYDVIVVGAGHNGLAAAVRLAGRGRRVLVVESNVDPGGAMKTRELIQPGIRHDVFAMNLSMFAGSAFFKAHQDELVAHGAAFLRAENCYASVFRDGTYMGVSRDVEKTMSSISAISAADAKAFQKLRARFLDEVPHLQALMAQPMPSWGTLKVVVGAWRAKGTAWLFDTLKLLLATPRNFIEAHFEHPKTKALFAVWGLHLDFAPDVAGGALFIYFQGMGNQAFGMALGQGGAGRIVNSMVGALKQSNGELLLGEKVARIDVENGTATGVTLANGRRLEANTIIANVNPKVVFRDLVPKDASRGKYERSVAKFRSAPSSMMIHLALDGRSRWKAGPEVSDYTYVHVAPDLEMMSRAYAEASAGLLPAEPALVVGQPTTIDPSRAPADKHVLWINVRVLPAEIKGDAMGVITDTTWDEAKEAYADRVLEILEGYMPGLKSQIIGRSVFSPVDLERENASLVGGDNLAGSHHLDQNFFLRPVPGWSRYRTPVRNLYVCGASTWPGSGTGAGSGFMLAKMLAG